MRRREKPRIERPRATDLIEAEGEPQELFPLPFAFTEKAVKQVKNDLTHRSIERSADFTTSAGLLTRSTRIAALLAVSLPKDLRPPLATPPDNINQMLEHDALNADLRIGLFGEARRAWGASITIDETTQQAAKDVEKNIEKYIHDSSPFLVASNAINIATITNGQLPLSAAQYTAIKEKHESTAPKGKDPIERSQWLLTTGHLALIARTLDAPPLQAQTIKAAGEIAQDEHQRLQEEAQGGDRYNEKDFLWQCAELQYIAWLINNPVVLQNGQFITAQEKLENQTIPDRPTV